MNNKVKTKNSRPLVSLIVATYNDCNHLMKVMECIQKQDYNNIEIVVIDGGSQDNTLNYLTQLSTQMSHFIWVSEKDKGIYDALNKGLKKASGDIIGCCYDYFADNHVISRIVETITNQDVDVVHGDLNYIDANGKVVRKWRMGEGKIQQGWMPAHPTLYVKRHVYEKYGLYDTSYRISADYDFMVRIFYRYQESIAYIPKVLINMEHGGTSTSSLGSYWQGIQEAHRALKTNGVRFPYWVTFRRMIRVFLQFVK